MFPEHDLQNCIMEYGHMTLEGLAAFVINNIDTIPNKRGTVNCFSMLKIINCLI